MSAIPVIEYFIGMFVLGFLDIIFTDVITSVRTGYWTVVNGTAVGTELELTDQLAMWFWHGMLIAWIILGAWWLWRKYNEQQYQRG